MSVAKDNASEVKNQPALQRRNSVADLGKLNQGKRRFSFKLHRSNSQSFRSKSASRKPNLVATEMSQGQKLVDQCPQDVQSLQKECTALFASLEMLQRRKCLSKTEKYDTATSEMKVYDPYSDYFRELGDLQERIQNFKSQKFDKPDDVKTKIDDIKAELANIRQNFENIERISAYYAKRDLERELKSIKENVSGLPESDDKQEYLNAINDGLEKIDWINTIYVRKRTDNANSIKSKVESDEFHQELRDVKKLIHNTIPESVRKGEGLQNVSKTQTASVSATKPSQAEIDAAQDALNQAYECYGFESISGPTVDLGEARLKDSYDTQMKYLQSMREHIVNDKKLDEKDKWALIAKINNQMRATRSEFNEAQRTYKDSEIVQGYKAVKTAIRNLQDAVDGKGGDLTACQEQLKASGDALVPKLIEGMGDKLSGLGTGEENVKDNPAFFLGRCVYSFKIVLNSSASKLIQDMAKNRDISEDLQASLEGLNPAKLSSDQEQYNKDIESQHNRKVSDLLNLRDQVKQELPPGHEQTKFLKEIHQGITKLRNLKRNKQANADTSFGQLARLKKAFDQEFDKITAFQDVQTKRLDELKNAPEAAGNFNGGIRMKCAASVIALQGLQRKVQAELKDSPEKTKFLEDIKQGIARLGELSKTWEVNANSLPNLADQQNGFDKDLENVMQLTKSFNRDRLGELQKKQKAQEAEAKGASKPIDQTAWNDFVQSISDRCDEQTKFLEGLMKDEEIMKNIPEEQREKLEQVIEIATGDLQDTRDNIQDETVKFNEDAEAFQKKVEKTLDKHLENALKMITIIPLNSSDPQSESMLKMVRGRVNAQASEWNLDLTVKNYNDRVVITRSYESFE